MRGLIFSMRGLIFSIRGLILFYLNQLAEVSPQSIPLGKTRKWGRPKNNTPALIKQPSEAYNKQSQSFKRWTGFPFSYEWNITINEIKVNEIRYEWINRIFQMNEITMNGITWMKCTWMNCKWMKCIIPAKRFFFIS